MRIFRLLAGVVISAIVLIGALYMFGGGMILLETQDNYWTGIVLLVAILPELYIGAYIMQRVMSYIDEGE